jgi:glucose dehydrogenase
MEKWAVSTEPEVHHWEDAMRKVLLATCLGSIAAFTVGNALANDELIKMSQNPKDWVMPTGDYANTRYSKLNQITAANVGKLQAARSRRRTAHHWQPDVRSHAIPKQGLRS